MNCNECEPRLPDFLRGGLEDSEHHAITGHLAACPRCSARAADFGRLFELMPRTKTPVDDRAFSALRVRINAAIDAQESTSRQPDPLNTLLPHPKRSLPFVARRLLQGGVLAGIALAIALLVGAPGGTDTQTQLHRSLQVAVAAMDEEQIDSIISELTAPSLVGELSYATPVADAFLIESDAEDLHREVMARVFADVANDDVISAATDYLNAHDLTGISDTDIAALDLSGITDSH